MLPSLACLNTPLPFPGVSSVTIARISGMHHNSNIKINQVYQIVEDLGINQTVCFRIGTRKGEGGN